MPILDNLCPYFPMRSTASYLAYANRWPLIGFLHRVIYPVIDEVAIIGNMPFSFLSVLVSKSYAVKMLSEFTSPESCLLEAYKVDVINRKSHS